MRPILDSAERWNYPPAWSCHNCRQSIAEVVFGISRRDGAGARGSSSPRVASGCGRVDGLTDMVVPNLAADVFAARSDPTAHRTRADWRDAPAAARRHPRAERARDLPAAVWARSTRPTSSSTPVTGSTSPCSTRSRHARGRLVGGVRQQRRPGAAGAAARGRRRRARRAAGRRRARDRAGDGPRAAVPRPLPRTPTCSSSATATSPGTPWPRRPAAAQPGVADRPPAPAGGTYMTARSSAAGSTDVQLVAIRPAR